VTSRRWIAYSLLAILVLAGATAAVNYRLNALGVFGDVRGKTYASGLEDDREAKYLFSFNYIPSNFDGVLVGTSVTGNWDTSKIDSARTYNLSVKEATITEEKILVENILAHGKLRLALFCLYPRMVHAHGRKTAYMMPRDYWTALGSEQLLRAYRNLILAKYGHRKPSFNSFGVLDLSNLESNPEPWRISYRDYHETEIVIDETAFAEYAALVKETRASGARVVGFVPPHESEFWNTPDYGRFLARMKSLFLPGELMLDFNDPRYDQYRNNPDNFFDTVHMAKKSTNFLVSELNARLDQPPAQ
jgi:hypothetical protein